MHDKEQPIPMSEKAKWRWLAKIWHSIQNKLPKLQFCLLWSLKTRIAEHKKTVAVFNHNSKVASHVQDHNHQMDFNQVKLFGHEANYYVRLFLEAWVSTKDLNAGKDHITIADACIKSYMLVTYCSIIQIKCENI